MRRLALTLAAACVAPATSAQKVCDSANLNPSQRSYQAGVVRAWFALPIQVMAPTVITAADFWVQTPLRSPADGTGQVGIWNANGRLPGTLLARASFTVARGTQGWHGGKFATPVRITTPGTYFVAMRSTGGVLAGVTPNPRTPYYWGPPVLTTWRGPINVAGWSYRVYCGIHGGAFVTYGTAKQGSGGAAPRIAGHGQPNTSNEIRIQFSNGLGGAPLLSVWGMRTQLALPFGTLYATPLVLLSAPLRGTGAGNGRLAIDLMLPNDASLSGVRIALQGWVVDPSATASLAHTGGLETTIGH